MNFIYVKDKLNPGQVNAGVQLAANGYAFYWWVSLQSNAAAPRITVVSPSGETVLGATLALEDFSWSVSTNFHVYDWHEYDCIYYTLNGMLQELGYRIADARRESDEV